MVPTVSSSRKNSSDPDQTLPLSSGLSVFAYFTSASFGIIFCGKTSYFGQQILRTCGTVAE